MTMLIDTSLPGEGFLFYGYYRFAMRRLIEQHLVAVFLFGLSLIVMSYAGFSAYYPLAVPGGTTWRETVVRPFEHTSSTTKALEREGNDGHESPSDEKKTSDFVYTSVYKSVEKGGNGPEGSSQPVSQNADQASQNEATTSPIFVPVTLIAPDYTYELSVPPEITVLALLEAAEMKTDFRYEARDYGRTLGQLVTEINGLSENKRTGHYWIYYVNGRWATEGVSHYTLNARDIIEWKYEKSPL